MLAALALLAAQPAGIIQQPSTAAANLTLYRGARLGSPRYWDVQDTYLDATDPNANFGGSYTLLGGKGRTILIRFGDLNRVLGPSRVENATLVLHLSGGAPDTLRSVGRVLKGWGEGPRTVIESLFMPAKPGVKPEPPRWDATYRDARSGFEAWSGLGASGPQDVTPITGAQMSVSGNDVTISGLGPAFEQMLEHPAENHGLALTFDGSPEFFSSESPNDRPTLNVGVAYVGHPSGPDLSVVLISRTPESASPGQNVTYTAHIKNVGDAPAKPFEAQWIVGEHPDRPVQVGETLAPGAEAELTLDRKLPSGAGDHRTHPLALRILPSGPDACPVNNELTIDENAIPVNVAVDSPAANVLSHEVNYLGSQSVEDWVQAQAELWNDTYAAGSRFSFAPDGALERIRISKIILEAPGTRNPEPGALVTGADPRTPDIPFLRSLGVAAGLLDGKAMDIPADAVKVPGSEGRTSTDLYPGLMGYGDTRFEGTIPGAIPLSYVPFYDQTLANALLEPTDLLSATDVAALNRHLDAPPVKPSVDLLPMGAGVLLRVVDLNGRPLPNADLLFFQSANGAISGQTAFAVKTNDSGLAVLASRGQGGPFGDLAPDGGNAVFLVQAKANGAIATAWLKAWELTDSYTRHAVTIPLVLNLPEEPIDVSTNLATDRLISDSGDDLPAKLAPLLGDDPTVNVPLPVKNGWVEIDLGRDRTFGEIDLVTKESGPWNRFDILLYGTGQSPRDAYPWTREMDWAWTVKNRGERLASGATVVRYRGAAQRARYIRFVNRSSEGDSSGPPSLAQIKILPARLPASER